MSNIQEEVRKLHFQLKQKDTTIHKLKVYIDKIKADHDIGGDIDSEIDADLNRIIQD